MIDILLSACHLIEMLPDMISVVEADFLLWTCLPPMWKFVMLLRADVCLRSGCDHVSDAGWHVVISMVEYSIELKKLLLILVLEFKVVLKFLITSVTYVVCCCATVKVTAA